MPMSLHGLQQLRQQRLQPLSTNTVGSLPEHDQSFFRGLAVNSLTCGSFPGRHRLRGQDTDRVFAVISGHFREFVQDQFLSYSICGSIALADCRGQLSTRRQLNFSPHLRLPAWPFYSTLGSILDEATTHCSVANMVTQCDGEF